MSSTTTKSQRNGSGTIRTRAERQATSTHRLRHRSARWTLLAVTAAVLGSPGIASAQWADVTTYGATGDGVTDDTSDIQDALDANLTVYFPEPTKFYKVSSLQLRTGHTLIGPGRWPHVVSGTAEAILQGDGTAPLLKTGDLSAMPAVSVRQITIRDVSLKNTDYPAIQLHNAPDFLIQNSYVGTKNNQMDSITDAPAIEGLQSYRGTIRDSYIGQSGTSWAISFMDNMNAVSIVDNTISGGSSGNGIDVGRSQNVSILGNDLEVCEGFGIRVAGNSNTSISGICSAVRIEGNYLEQVSKPFSLGDYFIVRGGKLCSNYVSNGTINQITTPPPYGVLLARVEDVEVSGNLYTGRGGMSPEPFLEIKRLYAAGVTELPVDCRIVDNVITGVSTDYVLNGMPNVAYNARVMGYNEMKYDSAPATGVSRVYTSPVITTANASVFRAWELATVNGGIVDKIEIIDVTGTIDGQLNIGCSAAPLEIAKVTNVGSLSYTNGAATVSLTSPMMRPAYNSTMSMTAMTASGSFRVRIHYRN